MAIAGKELLQSLKGAKREKPAAFDPALAERICERLTKGENLRRFCVWPDWPTKSTVIQWARENEAFGVRYRKILRSRERVDAITDKQHKNSMGVLSSLPVRGVTAFPENTVRNTEGGLGLLTSTRDHAGAREDI